LKKRKERVTQRKAVHLGMNLHENSPSIFEGKAWRQPCQLQCLVHVYVHTAESHFGLLVFGSVGKVLQTFESSGVDAAHTREVQGKLLPSLKALFRFKQIRHHI